MSKAWNWVPVVSAPAFGGCVCDDFVKTLGEPLPHDWVSSLLPASKTRRISALM